MIAHYDGRRQVCCDTCPASYPNTYAAEDFRIMIADAKAAGWSIRKRGPKRASDDGADLFGQPARIAGPAGKPEDPYIHTCPSCAADRRADANLFG